MKRFISVISSIFMFLCTALNGAEFRSLTINDGLSDNSVYVVYKDSRGFLWIGTHVGLNRYDGFRFKHFFEGPDAIPDNSINDIFEDSQGRLWIHTPLGYSYMDLSDEILKAVAKMGFSSATRIWPSSRPPRSLTAPQTW